MDKKDVQRIVSKPGMISLIHNYCDRWCERCQFTSRCAVSGIEEEKSQNTENKDINNKEFWNDLSEIFKLTLEMVYEKCEEMGIDIEEALDDTEAIEKEEQRRKTAKNEPGFKMSEKYRKKVDKWFKNSDADLKEKEKQLVSFQLMEIPGTEPQKEAIQIKEAIDVILWYQYLIGAKLYRAFHGYQDESIADKFDFPRDSDGSAKIALISIDRSMAAWGTMLKGFQSREDEILEILIILERLRKNVEKKFPDARSFVRPGFDEPNLE